VRERLIAALTKVAAERGYEDSTIDQVVAQAGLDREAFDIHFADRNHCMLAAYEAFVSRLMAHIGAACKAEQDWPASVRASIGAGLEFFAELAGPSRVFMVETMGAGPAAIERRFATVELLAVPLRRGRELYPAAAALPAATEQTLVAGIVLLASVHLLAEDVAALSRLKPDVVELALTPYVGVREARRVAGL
jgi:AcrR family transcriptional regulator